MSQPAAAKRLILIVDDDQLLLEFLGEVLRHAGYETVLANSAEVALQLGFADQSHFQRQFKQRLATTPRHYQQCLQGVSGETRLRCPQPAHQPAPAR